MGAPHGRSWTADLDCSSVYWKWPPRISQIRQLASVAPAGRQISCPETESMSSTHVPSQSGNLLEAFPPRKSTLKPQSFDACLTGGTRTSRDSRAAWSMKRGIASPFLSAAVCGSTPSVRGVALPGSLRPKCGYRERCGPHSRNVRVGNGTPHAGG